MSKATPHLENVRQRIEVRTNALETERKHHADALRIVARHDELQANLTEAEAKHAKAVERARRKFDLTQEPKLIWAIAGNCIYSNGSESDCAAIAALHVGHQHLAAIEKEIRAQTVGEAQKHLSDFELENRAVLVEFGAIATEKK